MRYIPKKKLRFDFNSPEGPLTLVFQGSDNFFKRAQNWKLSTAVSLPAAVMAFYTLGPAYWWAYPMLLLPTVFNLYDLTKLKTVVFRTEVYKMWLF
jgi:hypothetical protein